MTAVADHIVIHDGKSGTPLAGDWTGLCVDRRNVAEADPAICHTHDFCDANVVMATSFKQFFDLEVDIQASRAGVDPGGRPE